MELRLFQTVAALSSLVLTGLVLELIRRRKLKDELWLPWLVVAIAPLVTSLWIRPWAALAHWLGIVYEPALLLGLATLLGFAMLLYLTVVVSTLMRQNLRLAQDLALLRMRVESPVRRPRRRTERRRRPRAAVESAPHEPGRPERSRLGGNLSAVRRVGLALAREERAADPTLRRLRQPLSRARRHSRGSRVPVHRRVFHGRRRHRLSHVSAGRADARAQLRGARAAHPPLARAGPHSRRRRRVRLLREGGARGRLAGLGRRARAGRRARRARSSRRPRSSRAISCAFRSRRAST